MPRPAYRQVSAGRWRTDCMDCANSRNRERYRIEGGLERIRRDHWLRTYGLTVSAYAALMASQDGKCPVCDVVLSSLPGNRVHVDHDHRDGRVRGLLCSTCNVRVVPAVEALAPDLLARAMAYLQRTLAGRDL
ncbi:endonuclease domain-containing protein [Pseudofrankia sp. BMG5.37]|uniref:endonuclease domain-containing protein n=1 Tax=Pseudofrankia sp. BMG5.37 TaxID=3050035 RepID=UPI0009F19B8D